MLPSTAAIVPRSLALRRGHELSDVAVMAESPPRAAFPSGNAKYGYGLPHKEYAMTGPTQNMVSTENHNINSHP